VLFSTIAVTGLGIAFTAKSGDPRWIFLGLPFTLVLFVAGRYAPTGYRLGADGLHIERRAAARVIPYHAIRAVDREPRRVGGLSMLGFKGLFGHLGRFWNPTTGVHRLWLTNTHSIVWLRTATGWVAVSPDRPDEFVERLRARAGC
jgi:Bacterial PH domain